MTGIDKSLDKSPLIVQYMGGWRLFRCYRSFTTKHRFVFQMGRGDNYFQQNMLYGQGSINHLQTKYTVNITTASSVDAATASPAYLLLLLLLLHSILK